RNRGCGQPLNSVVRRMRSNVPEKIALTHCGEKVNASTVSQPVASVAVKSKRGAPGSALRKSANAVPGLAVEAASAATWRASVARGGERLTVVGADWETPVAAYEAHVNMCASPRKACGDQPLNIIR